MTEATTLPLGDKRTRERSSPVRSRPVSRRPCVDLVCLVAWTNINHESSKRNNRLGRFYRDLLLPGIGAPIAAVVCGVLSASPQRTTTDLVCRSLKEIHECQDGLSVKDGAGTPENRVCRFRHRRRGRRMGDDVVKALAKQRSNVRVKGKSW